MLTCVQTWLAHTDPVSILMKSLKLRSPGTGTWYLQSAQYTAWRTKGNEFTWLYGSAGSGKTFLSAGIIEDLQKYCNNDPAKSLAFFFFDFNDNEKQSPRSMLKSLLSQFLRRFTSVPEMVQSLYAACGNGRREASQEQLLQALRDTIEMIPAPFVVLDALDECSDWKTLLDILTEMQSWGASALRVLLTSRREIVIEEALEDIIKSENTICLKSHLVDKDIETYVHERLVREKSFRKWNDYKNKDVRENIEITLGRGAHGMYSLT